MNKKHHTQFIAEKKKKKSAHKQIDAALSNNINTFCKWRHKINQMVISPPGLSNGFSEYTLFYSAKQWFLYLKKKYAIYSKYMLKI